MSKFLVLFAVLALGLSGSFVWAQEDDAAEAPKTPVVVAPAAQVATGVVKSVEGNTFVLTIGEKEVKVTVNEKTAYTLAGKASTKDAVVKAGAKVKVTHDKAVASKVEA